jgi:prophage antirepressor-like protein
MNVLQTFSKSNLKLVVYGTHINPLFKASQIAETLEMGNIREQLRKMNTSWKVVRKTDTPGGCQNVTFLKEAGLYYFLMRSNKENAKPFQEWVCNDVLPSIRKTGSYEMKSSIRNNEAFKMESEFDLQKKVVHLLEDRYPDCVFIATLGENQNTVSKRIKSSQMGYVGGAPDLVINQPNKRFAGFAIEFKTPTGKGILSHKQSKFLKRYSRMCNYKTLVSNKYDDIFEQIMIYFQSVRIKCEFCNRKFKTSATLSNHERLFHKHS